MPKFKGVNTWEICEVMCDYIYSELPVEHRDKLSWWISENSGRELYWKLAVVNKENIEDAGLRIEPDTDFKLAVEMVREYMRKEYGS